MDYYDNGCDWYCDYCGVFMNRQPGFNVRSGEWVCTNCGKTNDVSEDNIRDEDEDDVEYFSTESAIPEGCAACGGDFPNCTTSCPLFDD